MFESLSEAPVDDASRAARKVYDACSRQAPERPGSSECFPSRHRDHLPLAAVVPAEDDPVPCPEDAAAVMHVNGQAGTS